MIIEKYDIIVVGAGHAGCEAAAASANMNLKTLLITMDLEKIAQMSCNPALGGVAKGQIVREIDALGGYSGIIADKSTIQFRMLNLSKGPAMWSPRVQSDRRIFSFEWRKQLESLNNLDLWQDTVTELIIEDSSVKGVKTKWGKTFCSNKVILTNGTFLNGLMHVGNHKIEGGRVGEPASYNLSNQLKKYGFEVGRMKTGTPVRIQGKTIDFSKIQEQRGDDKYRNFSFLNNSEAVLPQRSCYITYTSKEVHDVLNKGIPTSPMFDGTIKSTGPRYCPSIESKLVTFSGKDMHQLFVEPEGVDVDEYYLNGFSSSLDLDIQYEALRLIPGMENAKIYRPGYAIEYDYFNPQDVYKTLETKKIKSLYFAGQILGTTGYEEAGAQGLIAAINASLSIKGKNEFILGRDEAYIGVLIDDLVTKGVDEPYRMFTSRAEYRILLRQDNADLRLTEKSFNIGLASYERYKFTKEKYSKRNQLLDFLKDYSIKPHVVNPYLESISQSPINQKMKLFNIIKRPNVDINRLINNIEWVEVLLRDNPAAFDIIESAEIEIKYSGYIQRERELADKQVKLERLIIPDKIDYYKFNSISTEAKQKLTKIKPKTIGQARRISGVSPADINTILVFMGR